jgi:hypothetical protein
MIFTLFILFTIYAFIIGGLIGPLMLSDKGAVPTIIFICIIISYIYKDHIFKYINHNVIQLQTISAKTGNMWTSIKNLFT